MLKSKVRNDILLVLGFLTVALLTFLIFKLNMEDGLYAKVIVANKTVQRFDLAQNTEFVIETENNSNTLVIEDGKAFIKAATCPDKICVSHRKISKTGETIICLPNKVVVEIVKE